MLQVTEELRVVEEILLLVLDTDNGEIRHTLPLRSRGVAFAGAALMDLALEDRIDTDLEHLLVSDRTPLGNDLLDPILAEIARSGESPRDTASWITNLAQRSDEIREKALARLIERGILEAAPGGEVFLSASVSRSRRYRTADGRTTEEVQLRIMRTLFSDDIPDPWDIVIISLASACGVFESILSPDELAQVRERIDLVCRLDLIGREVAAAIRQVETVPPLAPTSVRPAAEIPQAAGLPLLGNVFGMAGTCAAFCSGNTGSTGRYSEYGPCITAGSPWWVPKRTSSRRRIQPPFSVRGSSITNSALRWAPIASSFQWTARSTSACAGCWSTAILPRCWSPIWTWPTTLP